MVKRDNIAAYLNELLHPEEFEDSTYNGLQIEGKTEIKKIGFCVDTAVETIEEAIRQKCDFLVVHHGLIWGGWKKITGAERRRVALLLENGINLYVSHLPLDKHEEIGNNISLLSLLGGQAEDSFSDVGYTVIWDNPLPFDEFMERIKQNVSSDIRFMHFNRQPVDRAAVCSGSLSPSRLNEALSKGIHTIIAGEGSSESLFYYTAQENDMNIIFAGHYATETFGLKNLLQLVSTKFNVETVWIDKPTGW